MNKLIVLSTKRIELVGPGLPNSTTSVNILGRGLSGSGATLKPLQMDSGGTHMIELIDGLFLDSDEQQVILRERKVVQNGKTLGEESFDAIGYYPTISSALAGAHRKLLNRKIAKLVESERIVEELKTLTKGA